MNKSRLLVAVCLFAVVALVLFTAFPATTQTGYSTINPKGKKATSPPISEYSLMFEITLASGKSAKLLVREGEMAKIGDVGEEYAFALVPVIKDRAKKVATFNIFQLTQDESGNEAIREVQRVDARPEATISTDTNPRLEIRLISMHPPRTASVEDSTEESPILLASNQNCSNKAGQNGGLDCCVMCDDGVWACGICVWRYCGCCCDSPRNCNDGPGPILP